MINFYKEDGIGKIAFANGDIVELLGRVSIAVDNTTNQLIIAEDGHNKYWIGTAGTIQVNGSNITGTNQQKAGLIAPVFQTNSASPGVTSYNDLTDKPTIPLPTTDASQLTTGTLDNARAAAGTKIKAFDYLIVKVNTNITAFDKNGDAAFSGTDAYTVIQATITALTATGTNGSGGGHIHISRGLYSLSNEIVIDGWEQDINPTSQLEITGDGWSTHIQQQTANKHGIVVKNAASVVLKDLRIYAGVNAKSCIISDSNGAFSNRGFVKSYLDNIELISNSTGYAALHLKNFFYLKIGTLIVSSSDNDAILCENNSGSESFGNSDWGMIYCFAGANGAGMRFISSGSSGSQNIGMLSVQHFECHSGYYGLYAEALANSTFAFVDMESLSRPIYFIGGAGLGEVQNVKVLNGYLLVANSNKAITCGLYSRSNEINTRISSGATEIPLVDLSNSRPVNKYRIDLSGGGVAAMALSQITRPNETEITYLTANGANVFKTLPIGTKTATPSTGDNSTQLATTAYVKNQGYATTSYVDVATGGSNKRVSWIEAQGGNTSISLVGLASNSQGTATTRSVSNSSLFTRIRRIGRVSATTANSKAGEIGNGNFIGTLGYTIRIPFFGTAGYNAGHFYIAGLNSFDSGASLPSTLSNVIMAYADPGDTNLKIKSGNSLVIDLGVNFPFNTSNTDFYDITFSVDAGATTGTYSVKRINTGHLATGTLSEVPSSTAVLIHYLMANNLATGVAATVDYTKIISITDY